MNVLWFVNVPLPAVVRRLGLDGRGSGHWLTTLAAHLASDPRVASLTVAHAGPKYEREQRFEEDGVRYVTVPAAATELTGARWCGLAGRLAALAERVGPDLVDVHGSEYAYGHVTPLVDRPVVLTIQGLIVQSQQFPYGDLRLGQVLARQTRSPRDLKPTAALLFAAWASRWREASEREIFAKNRYFLGRTDWDREWAHRLSPGLRQYHKAWRIERPEFYAARWAGPPAGEQRLFSCSRCNPQKGHHNLIAVLPRLRERHPNLRLRLTADARAGGWGGYLARLARRLGVRDHVDFLGYLSGAAVMDEMRQTSLYVHPTYQDNGPNSLAEAMLLGVPCVAADTAGVSSMIEDGLTGCLTPTGDLAALERAVDGLLADPARAARMGEQARLRALERHDPAAIVRATLDAYQAVIDDWHAVRRQQPGHQPKPQA